MSNSTKGSELNGIGGWLTFLIVVLTVISPLQGFGELVQTTMLLNLNPDTLDKQLVGRLSDGALYSTIAEVGMRFVAGLCLANLRTPTAPKIAILLMWIAPLTTVGTILLAAPEVMIYMFNAETMAAIIVSFLFALIWSLYLLNSRRVWNVYFRGRWETMKI